MRITCPPCRRLLLLLSLASGCILSADAAYTQWRYCEGSPIGDFTPTGSPARLVSSGAHTRLEMTVTVDSRGTASCEQLLQGSDDVVLDVDMLDSSTEYNISADRTCLPPPENDLFQRPLAQYPQLQFNISQELNIVGPLPTFSINLYLGPLKSNAIACISYEITPQLHQGISIALRYVPLAIFLSVLISALLTTLYASSSPPNPEQESQSEAPSPTKAILPGVGDCLQHLQFIFLTGSLTLHYPGFYQPVASYFSWASLFSPRGPITHGVTYPSVKDGIYEVNGTLTGSNGLELMAQVTGAPMARDIWLNMVILVLVIAAGTALVVQIPRVVPCIGFSSISDPPALRQSPLKQTTRNVLNVILGYFVTPIVAISAYQLDSNHLLPLYHLALATLLIVALLLSFAWMARNVPPRQLGILLLDSSKRYRRLGPDSGPETRDTFVLIFLTLAFVRGAILGGLQIFPLLQITLLAGSELCLFVSVVVLRPYRSVFSIFTLCCLTRLVVVVLHAAFLPTLNASIGTRSLVGYIILLLHAAVLAVGCFIPALYRISRLARTSRGLNDRPEIYGISQLRRRRSVINGLSSIPHDNGTDNQPGVSFSARSNGRPNSLSLNGTSSPNVREMPQYYRPQQLRASSSHFGGSSNLVSLIPMSSNSESRPASITTSPKAAAEPEFELRPISTLPDDNYGYSVPESSLSLPSSPSFKPLVPRWSDYTFREADLYYGRPQSAGARDDGANDPPQTPVPWSSMGLYVAGVWERLMGWKEREPKQAGSGFQVIRRQRVNGTPESIPYVLLQGTIMTKVTKKKKKLLTFVLDNENAKVSWDKNQPSKSFYIDDIKDIRVGANARNYRQEFSVSADDEPRFFSIVYAVPDQSKGRSQKVMHLIANNEQTLNLWTTTLDDILKHRQDLMASLSSFHDKAITACWRSEMNKQFQDKPNSDDVEQIDIVGVERLCRSLHILGSSSYLRSRFDQADVSRSGRLNFAQFQEFVKLMKRREDVRAIYRELASDSEKGITLEEFLQFLKDVQYEDIEANRAHWEGVFAKFIRRSKQTQQDASGGEISRMNEFALTSYLISTFNGPFDNPPAQYSLDRPLNEYFISSSHNTYLLGRQVAGQSSVEAYISALNRGCKCVEVDCWNGSDGPVVMHGRTLTSQVSFADVMATISKYAFVKSPYPLWISLEVHCNPTQQAMMAEIIKETCGSKLVTEPVDPSSEQLPTPSQLMNRILIKVKKPGMFEETVMEQTTRQNIDSSLSCPYVQPTQLNNSTGSPGLLQASPYAQKEIISPGHFKYSDSESQESPSSSTSDRESLTEDIVKAKESHRKNKTSNIIKVLGELGVYCAGVKFHGFDTPESKAYNHVFSFMENSFEKNSKTQEDKRAIIRHNMRYMMRVYPNGRRVTSTNFDPLKYWRRGAQMVALNWQTYDLGMQINDAMFASGTDQSGYVLKPSELREIKIISNVPKEAGISHIKRERKNVNFSIDVISAPQLMRPKGLAPTRSVDPYIEVEVYHPDDNTKENKGVIGEGSFDAPQRQRTQIVQDNGFNPIFDKKFHFALTTKYPDLIFVRWTIRCSSDGHNYSDRGPPLATYTAKLNSLKQGYRTLPLYDSNGEQFLFSTLFCRIKIEPVTSVYVNGPEEPESVSVLKTIGRTVWNRNQMSPKLSVYNGHQ